MSRTTLYRYSYVCDDFPQPAEVGRTVLYDPESLRAWVPTPLAAAAQQLYLLGERAGLGESDGSSVVTLLSPDRPG